MESPYARNVRLFILFRVLFNARWYYPVLAVLFLDLGLTMAQYAWLNVAWAVAIVGLEIPSGALADQIGRKRMVVLASALMVIEMAIFAFAPAGSAWLFPLFLLNRVLSGAAEAAASGADEALVYDSLHAEGRADAWPQVLARLMRWQSAGFFIAMLVGALAYDAALLQRICQFAGFSVHIDPSDTIRFPVYLTLGNAIVAFLVTLQFHEPPTTASTTKVTIGSTVRTALHAGAWILRSPITLAVILAGLCFDSIIRLFLTVGSSYYRLIGLPEASFGAIGSAFALLGLGTAYFAEASVQKWSMRLNFGIVAGLTLLGLVTISQAWRLWGIVAVIPIGIAMSLLQFFVSHYLNETVTDPSRRATVLSFRGLAFNLAYGGIGILFAALSRALDQTNSPEAAFHQSLQYLPAYFLVTLALLWLVTRKLIRPTPVAVGPTNEIQS